MGCRLCPRIAPRITITVKKKSSETGAKKVMRAASGPGLSRFGGSMPTCWPVTRLSKRHARRQPVAARARFGRGEGAGGEVDAVEVGVSSRARSRAPARRPLGAKA